MKPENPHGKYFRPTTNFLIKLLDSRKSLIFSSFHLKVYISTTSKVVCAPQTFCTQMKRVNRQMPFRTPMPYADVY
jgi:hypothetical protein